VATGAQRQEPAGVAVFVGTLEAYSDFASSSTAPPPPRLQAAACKTEMSTVRLSCTRGPLWHASCLTTPAWRDPWCFKLMAGPPPPRPPPQQQRPQAPMPPLLLSP
jgi:hypothetical protein